MVAYVIIFVCAAVYAAFLLWAIRPSQRYVNKPRVWTITDPATGQQIVFAPNDFVKQMKSLAASLDEVNVAMRPLAIAMRAFGEAFDRLEDGLA
jgi:hypothetical protein